MPAKNAADYIEECIDSIVDQEEQNWELIIVIDNSKDLTRSIVNIFAEDDQRISVYECDEGLIERLQTGYGFSKGEFITRMDADDIMPTCKLKELKRKLLEGGEGSLSTGLVKYFHADQIGEGFQNYEARLNRLCKDNNHYQEIYKESVIASPCWMIHRNDFDKVGAFDSVMYPEDYELVFRFYKNKLKIQSSDKVLLLWRDHANRASRNESNYATPHYFDLKMKYFLELDHEESKELILWGTGAKGKSLADKLQALNIDFTWMCDNERKFGVDIKGVIIESYEVIKTRKNIKLIIAVAQRNAQEKMKVFLTECGLTQNEDYYFFC
ncbi:MAG: glycosyltransferase [Flavobacteriales bacterium]|nr:glycosyltransferase [Flavobacteriales bacterium]